MTGTNPRSSGLTWSRTYKAHRMLAAKPEQKATQKINGGESSEGYDSYRMMIVVDII